jgi:hypothetical protein
MNGNSNTRGPLSHLDIALAASLALLMSTAAHADILATGAAAEAPTQMLWPAIFSMLARLRLVSQRQDSRGIWSCLLR